MKRYEMIKKSEDFNKIIEKGKCITNNFFRIFYLEKEEYIPKFGLAIGKKLGNAVTRNYIKRQLRMIVTNNKFLFKNNISYIIMVKKAYLNASYNELEKELKKLIEKVNRWQKKWKL